jgi:hypothetical protein
MPFAPYTGNLDPEALSILQAAFDQVWAQVVDSQHPDIDESSAPDLIAKRIMNAAISDGERDPDRLTHRALAAFRGTHH